MTTPLPSSATPRTMAPPLAFAKAPISCATVAAGGSTALYSSRSDSGWPMRSRMSCAIVIALYREPSNLGRLEDVAECDPPNILTCVYPELVVFVIQDVFFRLVVDDHCAIVRGPHHDLHFPAVMLYSCEDGNCCLIDFGDVVFRRASISGR